MSTNVMRMVGLVLASTLVIGGSSAMSYAQESKGQRTVTVSAVGQVSAEPDQAAISTGIVAEAPTARAALDANSASMRKLIDGLKAAGIDSKDVRTVSFNINPRYQTFKDGRPPVISGYQVQNQVRIVVRSIDRVGPVFDTAVTLGANQMGGIEFIVGNAEVLKDEARKQAMANALRRAKLLAAAGGAEVGEVLAIAEDIGQPQGRPLVAARSTMASDQVPIEHGSQQLEARVNVTWALK